MTQPLQCPRCRKTVSVAGDAGGTRVACPHCSQQFVVPGFVATSGPSEDDDWLKLDDIAEPDLDDVEEMPSAAPNEFVTNDSAPKTSAPKTSATKPSVAGDDDDLFGMDLPPLAPVKPRPRASENPFELDDDSRGGNPALGDDLFGDQPLPAFQASPATRPSPGITPRPAATSGPVSGNSPNSGSPGSRPSGSASPIPGSPSSPPPPAAVSVEYMTEFTVRCPVCGSPSDVKATQSGKQIRCRDCHTMIKVPPAPRKRKKVEIDLESAGTFTFGDSVATRDNRSADPFRRSATELLEAAEKVERDEPKPDLEIPKVGDWLKATFGIMTQPGVAVHWLILSVLASFVAGAVIAVGTQILLMSLFPAGIFFAAMVLACGFAIMQSVANDEESVSEWPLTLEPTEWLGPMVFCFVAAGLTGGPAWFAASLAFDQSLTTVFICMAAIFIAFPFVLLSMLDMQSIFVPFSPEVGRSVARCEEAWGGFYFTSFALFFVTFMFFAGASVLDNDIATAVIGITVAVAATFLYFGLLGRLAFSIGQTVNEKPRTNDIDSVRQSERDQAKTSG